MSIVPFPTPPNPKERPLRTHYRMPTIVKDEARDDHENQERWDNTLTPKFRMPQTIHCGPAFQTSNTNLGDIIEDTTGYEVIRGRFQIFVGRDATSNSLIHGEPIESIPAMEPPTKRVQRAGTAGRGQHHYHNQHLISKRNHEKSQEVVIQAFSLLKSGSNMSDITFADEDYIDHADFEPERLVL